MTWRRLNCRANFLKERFGIPENCSLFCEQQTKKQMTTKEYTAEQERLARFAKAMGHPARIAILEFLAAQECCFFGDIHEVLPISKATVSQHLSELRDAGLIQGTIEPPKVRYCINRENWATARRLFAGFFKENNREKGECCP